MSVNVADLRREYTQHGLLEADAAADPVAQFRRWLEEAVDAELPEPNAMTLATVSAEGRPDARIVLLKGVDRRGFVFYTNYESRKGQELARHPWATLVFLWTELERQVRITGCVERVPEDESTEYFHSRPRGSQLGAWASPQSSVIESRGVLEANLAEVEARYDGREVPRPPHWGGYVVQPVEVEFWQGRPNRLHDRLRYQRAAPAEGSWHLERLAP